MKEGLKQLIIESLEELNEQSEVQIWNEINDDTIIFGENSKLDSLDFVNLIVIIEERIFEKFEKSITMVSDKAFSKKYNPFKNIERLVEFIEELLENEI